MALGDRERWNERHGAASTSRLSPFLEELAPTLPTRGRALDVAGGRGQNAVWLARRGLEVTLADVSDVAVEQAKRLALQEGVELKITCVDLDTAPLPAGAFDLVVCLYFLNRTLFSRVPEVLAPGGLFVFAQPTRTNLERNPNPSARFVLEPGELKSLVQGLEVVSLVEAWTRDDKHEARLVARRAS